MAGYSDLISNASLQIYEYGIHMNNEMRTIGRRVPFYVMSYIKEGKAQLRLDGKTIPLAPKSVILIPPDTTHDHIKIGKDSTLFMWWHFDYKLYETIDLLKLLGMPLVFELAEAASFESAFSNYANAMKLPVTLQNTILKKANALTIMAHLLGAAEGGRNVLRLSMPDCFREMLVIILNSSEPDLTLSSFAKRFNMHPTYLSNRFKQYYGISPIALHRKVLLRRARDMLGMQGMSVAEVAELLGYKSASVFSRFFTKKTGYPPSHIITSARDRQSEQF